MRMPIIQECSVEPCAYNKDRHCHALAITVGDSTVPHCDTFIAGGTKGGDPQATGQVGACRMSSCRFNVSLECQAPGINVGYKGRDVECLTYQRR